MKSGTNTTNDIKLIAIGGVKGSGKNLVADMLQWCLTVPKFMRTYWWYSKFRKHLKSSWKKIAFADPLKRVLSIITGIPFNKFNNRKFKEDYCIDITNMHVDKSESFNSQNRFVDDLEFNIVIKNQDIKYNESNDYPSVFTIRQLMQYCGTEFAQKCFGKNVWINATLKNIPQKAIITDLRFIAEYQAIKNLNGLTIYINRPNFEFGQHASERELKILLDKNKFDIIIENNGTMSDLFNKIKQISLTI